MLFWCYALNYRPEEFFASSFLCRKTVPQHNIWLQKVVQLAVQGFKQSIQRRRLTTKSKYHIQTGLIWRHRQSRISPVTFWVRSPTDFKFSKRILVYSHEQVAGLPPPLSLPPNGLKILDVPIHLNCHFFVRTHRKGTLLPELRILMYLEDQYLSTTSKVVNQC